MTKTTEQMQQWSEEFGKEYTDRNLANVEELDAAYKDLYGITRSELNEQFLGQQDRSIKILEVGSNVGTQLQYLQNMGFRNLYGIELQDYAVELSKSRTKQINIIQGSAFDIPFKDEYFDLVFTSGVLIHISPSDIEAVLREIYRCTKEYIWGFEYYAEECTKLPYRGETNLLWKANFASLYLDTFADMEIVKEVYIPYLDSNNINSMFLIRKKKMG